VERRAAARHHDERILRHRIRPFRGQRDQHTRVIAHIHAFRPPVVTPLDELQIPAGPRMERVRHPHPRQNAQIRWIRRIRRVDPNVKMLPAAMTQAVMPKAKTIKNFAAKSPFACEIAALGVPDTFRLVITLP
jgi:hypothetical protein